MAYKILRKNVLNPQIFLMEVEAPLIAKKAEPGQFIILRIDEYGERVPFTIADFDREKGTVTIIVQVVGKTTMDLSKFEEGEEILDFAGPLGQPTPLEGLKKVAVIGGGLGTAIAYPQAKKLFNLGADVTVITGFRSKDMIILEDELKAVSNRLIVTTDDGSNGTKGLVTAAACVLPHSIIILPAYILLATLGTGFSARLALGEKNIRPLFVRYTLTVMLVFLAILLGCLIEGYISLSLVKITL